MLLFFVGFVCGFFMGFVGGFLWVLWVVFYGFCGWFFYYRCRYSMNIWNRIGVFALKLNSAMLMTSMFVMVVFVPVSHKPRDSAV